MPSILFLYRWVWPREINIFVTYLYMYGTYLYMYDPEAVNLGERGSVEWKEMRAMVNMRRHEGLQRSSRV